MGPVVVRAADAGDLEAVASLLGELNQRDSVPEPTRFEEVFQDIQQQDGLTLLVAEQGDELVGTLYLNIMPNLTRQCSPYALIENVVVTETRRGSGIGRALMDHAVDLAFSAGCYKVMLLTGRVDDTHEFYRSCGFSGDSKTAFVLRNGVHQQE